ncbi:J-domain-containing protein [Rhodotorula paludigena]|uniref:J-domain-containing protein n=1 Tax=Rhodotorula paludigena TaxID=86838 RepID=UPI00317362D1
MVKRILEDSYKPLRVKGYQKPIPQPEPLAAEVFESTSSSSSAEQVDDKPLPTRTLNPWDITFKAPDHYNPLPGYRAAGPAPGASYSLPPALSAKKAALAAARKDAAARGGGAGGKLRKDRLASAYERSLDYRGGLRRGAAAAGQFSGRGIAVPVHEQGEVGAEGELGQMKAWEGFIEEKIKHARRDGLFNNVKGRGKPMPKDAAEGNPFISRTEFLMNRILKEQEAAPPWVEMQKEVEGALAAFRHELRESWSRRAVRIRSSEGLTGAVVREVRDGWKDEEWEAKERAFHEASVKDLNELVRRYNIIAPYHVRRNLLSLRHELDTVVASAAPAIAAELQRRLDAGLGSSTPRGLVVTDPGEVKPLTADDMGGEQPEDKKDTMWKAFKRVVVEVLARPPDSQPVTAAAAGTRRE